MNSSDDEGLMDFMMKKDISKTATLGGANYMQKPIQPIGMKIGGGNPLMNKFKPNSSSIRMGGMK